MHPQPQAASGGYYASSAKPCAAIVVGEAGLANRPLATSHAGGPSRRIHPTRFSGVCRMYVGRDARLLLLLTAGVYLVFGANNATAVMLDIHERTRLNVEKKPRRATVIRPY